MTGTICVILVCCVLLRVAPFAKGFHFKGKSSVYDDYTYVKGANALFKVHCTPKSWLDAVQTCALEGATLVTPRKSSELEDILPLMPDETKHWIGYQSFQPSQGKKFYPIHRERNAHSFFNWGVGHPEKDNIELKYCVYIDNSGKYFNENCGDALDFICKKDRASSAEGTRYRNVKLAKKNGYMFSKRTNAYYKAHEPSTWLQALETCASEGAKLAAPPNKKALEEVLARRKPKKSAIWIGGHGLFKKGVFKLLNQKPGGYQKVISEDNISNKYSGHENCLEVSSSNKYTVRDCEYVNGFVCTMETPDTAKPSDSDDKCNVKKRFMNFSKLAKKKPKVHLKNRILNFSGISNSHTHKHYGPVKNVEEYKQRIHAGKSKYKEGNPKSRNIIIKPIPFMIQPRMISLRDIYWNRKLNDSIPELKSKGKTHDSPSVLYSRLQGTISVIPEVLKVGKGFLSNISSFLWRLFYEDEGRNDTDINRPYGKIVIQKTPPIPRLLKDRKISSDHNFNNRDPEIDGLRDVDRNIGYNSVIVKHIPLIPRFFNFKDISSNRNYNNQDKLIDIIRNVDNEKIVMEPILLTPRFLNFHDISSEREYNNQGAVKNVIIHPDRHNYPNIITKPIPLKPRFLNFYDISSDREYNNQGAVKNIIIHPKARFLNFEGISTERDYNNQGAVKNVLIDPDRHHYSSIIMKPIPVKPRFLNFKGISSNQGLITDMSPRLLNFKGINIDREYNNQGPVTNIVEETYARPPNKQNVGHKHTNPKNAHVSRRFLDFSDITSTHKYNNQGPTTNKKYIHRMYNGHHKNNNGIPKVPTVQKRLLNFSDITTSRVYESHGPVTNIHREIKPNEHEHHGKGHHQNEHREIRPNQNGHRGNGH